MSFVKIKKKSTGRPNSENTKDLTIKTLMRPGERYNRLQVGISRQLIELMGWTSKTCLSVSIGENENLGQMQIQEDSEGFSMTRSKNSKNPKAYSRPSWDKPPIKEIGLSLDEIFVDEDENGTYILVNYEYDYTGSAESKQRRTLRPVTALKT
jgi:hypothetical protein